MARCRRPELVRDVIARMGMRISGTDLVVTDAGRFQNLATVRSGLDDEDEGADDDVAPEAESASS